MGLERLHSVNSIRAQEDSPTFDSSLPYEKTHAISSAACAFQCAFTHGMLSWLSALHHVSFHRCTIPRAHPFSPHPSQLPCL